jgi:hypothetical protein
MSTLPLGHEAAAAGGDTTASVVQASTPATAAATARGVRDVVAVRLSEVLTGRLCDRVLNICDVTSAAGPMVLSR